MTLTFELDLANVNVNLHAQYLGERSFNRVTMTAV